MRRSTVSRLQGLLVRIPPGAWMSVYCVWFFFFHIDVSVAGWLLVQMIPTECGVSWAWSWSIIMRHRLTRCFCPRFNGTEKRLFKCSLFFANSLTFIPMWPNRESFQITSLSPISFNYFRTFKQGTAVAQWLRCFTTNRKVAGSIPDGVIGIFHRHNPSDPTMALWSNQPLIEMNTRSISWG